MAAEILRRPAGVRSLPSAPMTASARSSADPTRRAPFDARLPPARASISLRSIARLIAAVDCPVRKPASLRERAPFTSASISHSKIGKPYRRGNFVSPPPARPAPAPPRVPARAKRAAASIRANSTVSPTAIGKAGSRARHRRCAQGVRAEHVPAGRHGDRGNQGLAVGDRQRAGRGGWAPASAAARPSARRANRRGI